MKRYEELSNEEWRSQRLQDAVDQLDGGNKTAFGVRMGYKDGRYVRQMIAMERAISEKFILKFESVTGLAGWFDKLPSGTFGSLEQQLRTELSRRDVPEHTLRAFLDSVMNYPPRRRVM